ncbi:MAG: hypothetical protein ACK4RK_11020 [Gemmataceae bacterium]
MTSTMRRLAGGPATLLVLASWGTAQEFPLRETHPEGTQYHVSNRVELSGTLTLPADMGQQGNKTVPLHGSSAIEYDERILALTAEGKPRKTARIYRRIDFERKIDGQAQKSSLRAEVRRLVVLRHGQTEVAFSPDGAMTWGELDLVRTDVFTPALSGLLPAPAVRPGADWPAATAAVQELTDLDRIEEGNVTCRLEQVTTLGGRRYARITLAGTVRGVNEDGPNKQMLDGYFFFDLESNHISYLYLNGVHVLLDKDGKETGRLEGRFVLTRQVNVRCPDLEDAALRGVALEPNDDNTLMLYEHPDLGVRLTHPRRWRIGSVGGRQITLDESRGSGLLITLEPLQRVPGGVQFLAEAKGFLEKQKAKIFATEMPKPVPSAPPGLERFALDVEINGVRQRLEYYIVKQEKGGAILAARLLPADQDQLRQDVERIARGLRITKGP